MQEINKAGFLHWCTKIMIFMQVQLPYLFFTSIWGKWSNYLHVFSCSQCCIYCSRNSTQCWVYIQIIIIQKYRCSGAISVNFFISLIIHFLLANQSTVEPVFHNGTSSKWINNITKYKNIFVWWCAHRKISISLVEKTQHTNTKYTISSLIKHHSNITTHAEQIRDMAGLTVRNWATSFLRYYYCQTTVICANASHCSSDKQ